jgi:citrate lyase subunit beta/citryl-CoA lyase
MKALAPRTLLFIPASRPDFVAKAHLRGADAIILDLEDSVARADKGAARARLPEMHAGLTEHGLSVWVRINALYSGGLEDLDVIAKLPGSCTVMLPKSETPAQVLEIGDRLRGLGAEVSIAPLIETPAGVIGAPDIAAVQGVCALAFGSEDFAAALGVAPTEDALVGPAQWVVLAAAANGIAAFGLPGSLANFTEFEALARLGDRAASIGFSGALCIHPAQVAVLNPCFFPTPNEIAWAGRILAHVIKGTGGATALDGAMIDPPVVARAEKIMARAQRS